jgi:HEAT repeat protein
MGFFGSPNVVKMKAKKDIEGLIKTLYYKNNIHIRQHAAEALRQIDEAHTLEILVDALNEKDDEVREMTIQALVQIGPSAVKALIKALKNQETLVRRSSAQALGRISDPRAIKPLSEFLNTVIYMTKMI